MTSEHRLADIFPLPPLVANKRPPNIKQKLIRAKIPGNAQRNKRDTKGTKSILSDQLVLISRNQNQQNFQQQIVLTCWGANCASAVNRRKQKINQIEVFRTQRLCQQQNTDKGYRNPFQSEGAFSQ